MPFVYMMGADWSESFTAGKIIGIKLIPNEMLAYFDLGELRTNGESKCESIVILLQCSCILLFVSKTFSKTDTQSIVQLQTQQTSSSLYFRRKPWR